MAGQIKENDVLQLLKDYRAYHTAYGGAMPWDEQGVAEASYGPAGYVVEGQEYTKKQRLALTRSYWYLERALRRLKAQDFPAWMALLVVYLGDPADPGQVEVWREKKDKLESARMFFERHNRAVKTLARTIEADMEARGSDPRIYAHHPKFMSEAEEKEIENQNADIFHTWQRLRAKGMSERQAAELTADSFSRGPHPLSVEAVERIVEFRDTIKPKVCMEPGCDSVPSRQGLCMKHYQQQRRRRLRRAGTPERTSNREAPDQASNGGQGAA